jgi:histamine receptor H3
MMNKTIVIQEIDSLKIFLFIIMLLVAFLTVFGNFIVILCFMKFKHIRTNTNYYILSLSIADFLIGIIIPFYAHKMFNNGYWYFGFIFCRLWLIIDYVAGTASVLQIVVISLDRFISVVFPFKYRQWSNRKIIFLNIFLVWVIAFLNYGPAIILWPILTNVSASECRAEFRNSFYYLIIATSIEFFLPFISILIFNFSIYVNIRKRSLKRSGRMVLKRRANVTTPYSGQISLSCDFSLNYLSC